jgi:hypothetical protein
MYRHNQEFGESIDNCVHVQVGIHHDEPCQSADKVSEWSEMGMRLAMGRTVANGKRLCMRQSSSLL